jgi:predicted DNA-binding transcriptional regulator AlpA
MLTNIAQQFATVFTSAQPHLLGLEQPRLKPAKPQRSMAAQPRRGLRRGDAAAYVGVSPSKFDQMVIAGRMPKAIKMDACAVWDMRQLDQAFDELIDQGEGQVLTTAERVFRDELSDVILGPSTESFLRTF